jgi:hypothetical protein
MCNAGYQLEVGLCAACPVGKARPANNSNSIMCETCAAGTFTSVSATVSCGACSRICQNQICRQIIYDFTPYTSLTLWKNYAASIGATTWLDTYANFWGRDGVYVNGGPPNDGFIQLTLPKQYNHVTVDYTNVYNFDNIRVYINQVIVQSAGPHATQQYSQTYTSDTVLKIVEQGLRSKAGQVNLWGLPKNVSLPKTSGKGAEVCAFSCK